MDNPSSSKCANCGRTALYADQALKTSAKCKGALYCSRNCKNTHRKKHRKECGKPQASLSPSASSSSPKSSPESPIFILQPHPHPFQALTERQWLSNRHQHDVYKLLHDSFRLRLEDNYSLKGEIEIGSIYHNDNKHSFYAFEHGFLRMAAERGLTPAWLNDNTVKDCLRHGERVRMDTSEWGGLRTKATEEDIVKWYCDESMPLQMRIFAEQIYGDDPSGQVTDAKLKARFMARLG